MHLIYYLRKVLRLCLAHVYFFPQATVQECGDQHTGDSSRQEGCDQSVDAVRIGDPSAGLLLYTAKRFQKSTQKKNRNAMSAKRR